MRLLAVRWAQKKAGTGADSSFCETTLQKTNELQTYDLNRYLTKPRYIRRKEPINTIALYEPRLKNARTFFKIFHFFQIFPGMATSPVIDGGNRPPKSAFRGGKWPFWVCWACSVTCGGNAVDVRQRLGTRVFDVVGGVRAYISDPAGPDRKGPLLVADEQFSGS